MRLLIDHSSPFLLAHGGVQVQIEQTKLALARAGIDVECVRWWDERQSGDVIHYFGPVPQNYLSLARQKRIPVVLTAYFSSTCNRSNPRLRMQGMIVRGLLGLPGWDSVKTQLQWYSFREARQIIVGLQAERRVLEIVYGVPASRIDVVPLGLDDVVLAVPPALRTGDYLISVGTIRDVKRSVDVAKLALVAEVPILFVGNPYSELDPYWQQFQRLIDNRFVRHRPHITDRAVVMDLLSAARGFVLFSEYENWSLAAHEAAACGLPLLLPDLKWSRECFGDQATYFKRGNDRSNIQILKDFYVSAGDLPAPQIESYSWDNIAGELVTIYEEATISR
jgi:glycosyltransferase involved in cell wall biosynthesis